MDDWARRLHHDLVRPLLWRAHDVREDTQAPDDERRAALTSVLSELYDDEGQPVGALASWARFASTAPRSRDALAAFGAVLARVVEVLADRRHATDACVAAVVELEAAFATLAKG